MNETQRRFLRNLRDGGPLGLRRSSVPKRCSDLVEELRVCGAVEFCRATCGRGIVLRIKSEQAFRHFIASRLPSGLDVSLASVPDHAAAAFLLADAKAVRRSIAQGIFVRSIIPGTEIRSLDGEVCLPVTKLTADAGGVALQLSVNKSWAFSGEVAIVENIDAFWRYELVLPDVDLAILGSGRMSKRLIDWLSSPQMAECCYIHWGDYDPVGVSEYLRLAKACPGRVQTYAPQEVDRLLPKRGKRALVIRQSRCLDQLRDQVSDPHVHRMLNLFDNHRRGLEQEFLLYRI